MEKVFPNPVLLAGLAAWSLAQILKLPIEYRESHRINWALLISPGGMPSSHSALVTSTALAVGLFVGFDSALFGVAMAVAMIVVYDATGIRRQAGMHAQKINMLINELFSGQPIPQEQLREVLGHTPLEALGGILLGLGVSFIIWLLYLWL